MPTRPSRTCPSTTLARATRTTLPVSYSLVGGLVIRSLVAVVLLLGATCLTSLAVIGVMMYRLARVEDKLQEMDERRLDERLLRLEMRLAPRAAPVPKPEARAVAD